VQWKRPELDVISEPRLGENFRILLPQPDYEANYFNSRDQVVRRVDKSADRIVLFYGPLKNEREEVDVEVIYEIRDTGSQLNFSIQVNNATARPLAEVLFGIIGGQQGIDERLDTESHVPGGFYSNYAPKLFSQYRDIGEDVAVRFDSAGFSYPGMMAMGWVDIFNPKAALGYYYANQDPEIRITALYTEMHPYVTRSITSNDNWPRRAILPADEPIGLMMGWIYFPYTRQDIFRAGPIALQAHEGDWRAASKLYRAWFDRHFKLPSIPSWLRKEAAWHAVVMLTPEDVILHRFVDLPRLASEAKRYGVTTLEIFGWSVGGLDRDDPNYTPDPRLGTVDEFRKALADVRAIGVHPLLFGNVQVADTSTSHFRERLSQYTLQGRWAPDWRTWGFGESTIGARMLHGSYGTTLHRNFAWVSPSHPEFREELVRQFVDRVQDGAEGLAIDKADAINFLDFNPRVPTSPDKSLPQGLHKTYDEFLRRARRINPNVALAADFYDRSLPYSQVVRSYLFAAKDADSMAVKYTFPEMTSIVFAETPENFSRINNGLRYGLVWDIAPRHYTDSMDEELTRPLSHYLSELIRIRKQYVDLLFQGRFNDTVGAHVAGDGETIRYSVFSPLKSDDPRRACVVVNFGDQEEGVTVTIEGKDGLQAKISMPFQPDRIDTLPVELNLPPQRAAVVVTE
jgi:hypothetical protein